MNEFTTITCPLCHSDTFTVVYPGTFPEKLSQDFLQTIYRSSSDNALFEQVVRCRTCDLVYLNPRLDPTLIIDSYAEGNDMAFVEQDEMRLRTFTSALRQLCRKYNIPLSDKTKILDVGCAAGAFLRAAQSLGLNAIGLEPNKWMSEYARSTYGIDVRSGTLSDHVFPESSFDLITLWDVIEHVPDPEVELRAIHNLLKPGGLLVVNYPDFGSLPARLLGRKWPFLLSVHLVYYTRPTIKKHLESLGYKVLSMKMHWQTLELRYILKRIIPYFPFVRYIAKAVDEVGLGSMPFMYWIGQTRVVARR